MADESNTTHNAQPQGATTGEFLVQFSLIIIGLAFGYGIDRMVDTNTFPAFMRFLTLFVVLAIWLHSQISFGLSETYWTGSRWYMRVVEYYLELIHLAIPMLAALNLPESTTFHIWIVFAFVGEIALGSFYLLRLKVEGTEEEYGRERSITLSWLPTGLVVVILCSVVLIGSNTLSWLTESMTSILIFIIIFLMMLLDYALNPDFYFGLPKETALKISLPSPRRRKH